MSRRRRSFMERVGQLLSEQKTIKARPTTYKGVEFRSRLEARFAWHLDEQGEDWIYEPRRYGPKGRGYLPDFEIVGATFPTFIELKPTLAEVEAAKEKMAVIWDTHPDALLIVACAEGCWYHRAFLGGDWLTWQERWVA